MFLVTPIFIRDLLGQDVYSLGVTGVHVLGGMVGGSG